MREDITGFTYGRLKVLGFCHSEKGLSKQGHHTTIKFWKCKCTCGKVCSFPRANITGHKNTMCPECLEKFKIEWKEKGRKTNGARIQTNYESAPRGSIDGFIKYWRVNTYMFRDTFNREYSEEVAKEEFNKIMNWEGRNIGGDN